MELPNCIEVARPIADMEFPVHSGDATEMASAIATFERALRAIGNGFPQSDQFLEVLIDQATAMLINLVELAQDEDWSSSKLGVQLLVILSWASSVCIGNQFFVLMTTRIEKMLNHDACSTPELK